MGFVFEEKKSDSPLVDVVYYTQSDQGGTFTSSASAHWEMVVRKHEGKMTFTVRGPETKASVAEFPADAEYVGIQFKHGAFMPTLPPGMLIDHQDLNLPYIGRQLFRLNGAAWEFPTFENVDMFIARLVHDDLLVYEPTIDAALQGDINALSLRSIQRRFLQVTGLTHTAIQQIERARYAAQLLRRGTPILDTVFEAGYFDQPHLTRSMKRLIGQTPAQIVQENRSETVMKEDSNG